MLYTEPWEHPSAVAALSVVILLSAWINFLTHCIVAYVAISTGWLSNVLRQFFDPDVNFFIRLTLPTINRKHFLINMLCIEPSCPQKTHNRICSLVVHSSGTVTILTTETSLCVRVCYQDLSWSWAVLLPNNKQKPIMSITAVLLPLVSYILTLPYRMDRMLIPVRVLEFKFKSRRCITW
jgi:hypothetical protein